MKDDSAWGNLANQSERDKPAGIHQKHLLQSSSIPSPSVERASAPQAWPGSADKALSQPALSPWDSRKLRSQLLHQNKSNGVFIAAPISPELTADGTVATTDSSSGSINFLVQLALMAGCALKGRRRK